MGLVVGRNTYILGFIGFFEKHERMQKNKNLIKISCKEGEKLFKWTKLLIAYIKWN
jgi:hypothetical protein